MQIQAFDNCNGHVAMLKQDMGPICPVACIIDSGAPPLS